MVVNVKKWGRKLPALAFLVAASYLYLRNQIYRAPQSIALAELQLKRLDGASIPAASLSEHPAIVNFWAPWCPPCRMEMPWLSDLQKSHPETTILGLEDDDAALEQARALERSGNFSYILAASNQATRAALGHVAVLPTTLYISPSGRVVHTVTGLVPEPVMQRYLADAIRAK